MEEEEDYSRRHEKAWEGGDGVLVVIVKSKKAEQPSAAELSLNTTNVHEAIDDALRLRARNVSPVDIKIWPMDPTTISASFQTTRAWAGISASVDATPDLPADVSAYFKGLIVEEIRAAGEQAARDGRRPVWVFIAVDVRAYISYDDYVDFGWEFSGSDEEFEFEEEEEEFEGGGGGEEETGASLKAIYEFVRVEILAGGGDGSVQACSVCLDEMEEGFVVDRMPCGHVFHSDCIIRWLRRRNSCPLCRASLPEMEIG